MRTQISFRGKNPYFTLLCRNRESLSQNQLLELLKGLRILFILSKNTEWALGPLSHKASCQVFHTRHGALTTAMWVSQTNPVRVSRLNTYYYFL